MGESSIGWLHPPAHGRQVPWGEPGMPGYTANPWVGCQRRDPECENCYAERRAGRRLLPSQKDRSLPVWGPQAPRHMTSEGTLALVRRWHRAAEAAGEHRLIFGGSQMDWLEDRADVTARREWLLDTIEATPHLRWIMLTKRPENFARLVGRWRGGCPRNVWVGISAGSQRSLDRQLEAFERIPAAIKLISGEPLIAPVDFTAALKVARWLILGGESGARPPRGRARRDRRQGIVRPCDLEIMRAGVRAARAAGRHIYVKQLGAFPLGAPSCAGCEGVMFEGEVCERCGDEVELAEDASGRLARVLHLKHPKGEDPSEWPLDLRIQEWPCGAAYLHGGATA